MSVHCSVYKFDPYKQVRYGPHLPLVLKGLTCTFPGGMKVGVVGRTGSGKSTLIQSIFRIVEPTKGRIVIDGIDISTIGLLSIGLIDEIDISIQPYLACIFLSIRGLERQHLTKLRSHGSLRVFQEQTGETDKVYLELEIRGKVELRRSPVQLHSNILDFRTGHPCD